MLQLRSILFKYLLGFLIVILAFLIAWYTIPLVYWKFLLVPSVTIIFSGNSVSSSFCARFVRQITSSRSFEVMKGPFVYMQLNLRVWRVTNLKKLLSEVVMFNLLKKHVLTGRLTWQLLWTLKRGPNPMNRLQTCIYKLVSTILI